MLLHGQPGSPLEWQAVVAKLRVDRRVLVPTRPGYSGDPGEATGWAGNAAALLDLLDAAGIERALVVGLLLGGRCRDRGGDPGAVPGRRPGPGVLGRGPPRGQLG